MPLTITLGLPSWRPAGRLLSYVIAAMRLSPDVE
jgi:hypothetical protein